MEREWREFYHNVNQVTSLSMQTPAILLHSTTPEQGYQIDESSHSKSTVPDNAPRYNNIRSRHVRANTPGTAFYTLAVTEMGM